MLNEETSKIFFIPNDYVKRAIVIFTLSLEIAGPKDSGDDETRINVGHFVNSFMANYCILTFI